LFLLAAEGEDGSLQATGKVTVSSRLLPIMYLTSSEREREEAHEELTSLRVQLEQVQYAEAKRKESNADLQQQLLQKNAQVAELQKVGVGLACLCILIYLQ
jgi:hypothetical protein